MTDLIDTYLACWNETDAAARRRLLDAHWAPDARYTDPMADVAGVDALDATVAAVQGQFPGWVFTVVDAGDAHHRQARFTWGLGPAGEEPPVVGFDVVETDEQGRIARVLGFLDRVPG